MSAEGRRAKNQIVAGLDQDWSDAVRVYNVLTPLERVELALWLTGRKGDIRKAPDLIINQIKGFASVGFLEAAYRRVIRMEEDASDQGRIAE